MKGLKNMRRKWCRRIRSSISRMDNEYNRMKIVLMIFKLFGLAPCNIDRPSTGTKILNLDVLQTSQQPQLAYSRLGCAYNIVLSVILGGMWIVAFTRLYLYEYPNKSRFTVISEAVLSVSGNIFVIALRIMFCIKQDTAVKLFNRLTIVDRDVFRTADLRNSESNGLFVVVIFLTETFAWIVIVLTTHWCIGNLFGILVNLTLPTMTMSWLITQYVIIMKLMECRFRALNRALLETSNYSVIRSGPSLVIDDNSLHPACCPKIVTFRQTHATLCNIARDVSKFYSIPILLSIVRLYSGLMYSLYITVIPIVLQDKSNSPCVNVRMLGWLIITMFPIVMLTAGIDRTNSEINKTADAVHAVLARASTSEEDKAELRVFSLELYQRNVEFTACGLFTLNCALLHSIFSSTVMNLIIIIQLQLAEAKKSGNISNSTAD